MVERGSMLLAITMGGGKTVISIAAVERMMQAGTINRTLVVVPSMLKYQWQAEIQKFTTSPSLVIDGTPQRRQVLYEAADRYPYVIINYEAVVKDWTRVLRLLFDCLVVDECFPAGTMIDTPSGQRGIEQLRAGDVVLNAVGSGVVHRAGNRQAKMLLRVVLDDGSVVVATPGHNFLTREGWLPARLLHRGSECVPTDEAVRMVRSGVPGVPYVSLDGGQALGYWSVLREVLLSEVEDESARVRANARHCTTTFGFRGNDAGVPRQQDAGGEISILRSSAGRVDRGDVASTAGDLEEERQRLSEQAREWHRANRTGGVVAAETQQALGVESRHLLGPTSPRVSDELQGGLGVGVIEAGGRGGRQLAQGGDSSIARREEERHVVFARVDRVEVLEPGHPEFDRLSGGADQVDVFNLEVGGHPSFSVSGLLVHNCSYIKGFRANRSKKIKGLGARCDIKFGLTGQPVENRPEELFSIMEFVDPEVLGGFSRFDRTFIVRDWWGRPKYYRNLPLMHSVVAPAMVRKSREDIADQLPRIVPTTLPIVFTRAEARFYNEIKDRLLIRMDELIEQYGTEFSLTAHYGREDEDNRMKRAQGEVMSMVLALRLACVDIRLVLESAKHYDVRPKDDNGRATDKGIGSQFAWRLMQEGLLTNLPKSSKLTELRGLVNDLLEESDDSKVVIFSTFKGTLRALHEILAPRKSVMFTGDMNARQKDAAKRQFASDTNTRLFLSSDAGGYGVDLPMANYLISVDLPWSTGRFEQRESRIIRISSEFEHINLIATIVRGSIEQRILEMLETKKGIASAFVDGKFNSAGRYDITLSSLTQFLREHEV